MDRQLPAICTTCNKISFNFRIKSNKELQNFGGSYLCPYCKKGQAVLRYDVYKIINNLIDDIKTATPERVVEIKALLNQYNNPAINNFNFNALSSEIVNKAPELKSLKDLIPQTRMEAYAVIGIFLTIVTIVSGFLLAGGQVDNKKVLDTAFPPAKIVPVLNKLPQAIIKPKTDSRYLKLGRNDKCHCGSGKKYKNCHGAGR